MRSLALLYPEILVGTYYRRTKSGNPIPENGGLVIYINHSNGLIDGGMGLFLTNRQQRFLAKASLFRIPILQTILRAVGAIPIYRQKDKVDMARNRGSFNEVHDVLLRGEVFVIYPEGESRLGFALRPFRTGAARMVLGAEHGQDLETPLRFVPTILVYEEQDVFLSRAHAWLGEPFDASAYAERYNPEQDEEGSRETVRLLTEELHQRQMPLTIPAPDSGTFDAWVQLDRVLEETPDRVPERLRSLGIQWNAMAANGQEAQLEGWKTRLADFARRLKRLGLEGYDLKGPILERSFGQRMRSLGTLLLGLSLTAIWLPPLLFTRGLAHATRSTRDKVVTMTVVGCSLSMPIWTLICAFWLAPFIGFWLALLSMVLSLAAWITLVRRAGQARPMRRACTLLGLQGSPDVVDSLWIEKQSLHQEWMRASKANFLVLEPKSQPE